MMKPRPARSVLTVLPVLGISVAAGTTTTAPATATPAPRAAALFAMVPLGSDWELNGVSCPSASLCYAAGGVQ